MRRRILYALVNAVRVAVRGRWSETVDSRAQGTRVKLLKSQPLRIECMKILVTDTRVIYSGRVAFHNLSLWTISDAYEV